MCDDAFCFNPSCSYFDVLFHSLHRRTPNRQLIDRYKDVSDLAFELAMVVEINVNVKAYYFSVGYIPNS